MSLTAEQLEVYYRACSQPQSNYALKNFVDGGQLTPHRKFRQAIIELSASQDALFEAKYQLQVKRLELQEKQIELTSLGNDKNFLKLGENSEFSLRNEEKQRLKDIFIQKKRLEIERIQNAISSLTRSLEGKAREMQFHLNMVVQYKQELGIPDDAEVDTIYNILQEAEGEYYRTKLALDIAAQFVQAKGGPQQGVVLALQQLEKEDLEKVTAIAHVMIGKMLNNEFTPELHSMEGLKSLENLGMQLLESRGTSDGNI